MSLEPKTPTPLGTAGNAVDLCGWILRGAVGAQITKRCREAITHRVVRAGEVISAHCCLHANAVHKRLLDHDPESRARVVPIPPAPKVEAGKPHGPVAYTSVLQDGRWILGVAEKDEPGYGPVEKYGAWPTKGEAQAVADDLNERMGVSAREAAEIVLSSIGAQMRRKGGRRG